MRPQSRLVATFLVMSLLSPVHAAASTSDTTGTEVENLGIVVASHSATLGNGVASDGATLYNGDRLVTSPNGGLSLRSGAAMLYMGGSTQIILHRTTSRNPVITKSLIRADVSSGSISFSLAPDQYFLVSAHGALIGPAAPMPQPSAPLYAPYQAVVMERVPVDPLAGPVKPVAHAAAPRADRV